MPSRRDELDSLLLPCALSQIAPVVGDSVTSEVSKRVFLELGQIISPDTAQENDLKTLMNEVAEEFEETCQTLSQNQYQRFSGHDLFVTPSTPSASFVSSPVIGCFITNFTSNIITELFLLCKCL